MSNKVITASAGTGKTYTLSLEYIKCLIEMLNDTDYKQCFSKILVITFTKKATAEIRSRIFKQLEDLVYNKTISDVYEDLGVSIDDNMFVRLSEIYRNMCINRHCIQIRTIDGFINLIWKNVAARLNNVTGINDIIDSHGDDIYLEVMDRLWHEDCGRLFKEIYFESGDTIGDAKSADKCIDIIRNLIDMREIFVMREDDDLSENNDAKENDLLIDAQNGFADMIIKAGECINSRKTNKYNPSKNDLAGEFSQELKKAIELLDNVDANEEKTNMFCKILTEKINREWLKENA
ncbi:MAG: UvrD-helicase domain-containing protein, partial [Spirochaetales bacterium]|nr:UvrD-helicase domain-containing protein [Spirochaetales bacterium]